MKRTAIDVIRRGFDNTLANWPLILIRLAGAILTVGIVVVALLAAVVPVIVSAGLTRDVDMRNPESVAAVIAGLFIEHWMLLVYLIVLAFILFGIIIAVHSFVEAGCAQVYVDGERAATRSGAPVPPRTTYNAFATDRWFRAGARHWWSLFWIYNFAWSVGALVLLVPLVITIALMLAVGEAGARIVAGCAGLALTFLLLVPTAIAVSIWVQKAIAVCVGRSLGAVDALRAARREIKLDFGRHLAVGIVMIVLGWMAAVVLSSMSIPFSFHDRMTSFVPLFFSPMQMGLSAVQNAFGAAFASWFLASFVALAEERPA